MSGSPVVIEVTRGPVVESRHEGIAAVVRSDGTVVDSWGDIDAVVLPRSANKPIQAMAFVETGDLLVGAEIAQGHLRYLEPGQPAEIAFKMYPGRVYDAEVMYVLPASAVGQAGLSGFAAAPTEIPNAPFWVRLKLGEEAQALNLPVGATGSVAIYTQKGKGTHVIRKVVIRTEAIMNWLIPN